MMRKLHFTINMAPVAKKSPKAVVVAGHAAVHRDAGEREQAHTFASLAIWHAPAEPLQGPLLVRLTFRIVLAAGRAAGWEGAASRAGLLHPTGRPDVDNYCKFTLDALTRSGRFWRDDAQVVRLVLEKEYAKSPSTIVEIEELPHVTSAKEWKALNSRVVAPGGSGAAPVRDRGAL